MTAYEVKLTKALKRGYSANVKYFDEGIQRERSIYLASKVDPIEEGEVWANFIYKEAIQTFIIYGLGLGYHVEALSKRLVRDQKIIVLESNSEVYHKIKPYIELENFESKENQLIFMNSLEEASQVFTDATENATCVVSYKPSLHLIPRQLDALRNSLESYRIRQMNVELYEKQIEENCAQNTSKSYKTVQTLRDKVIIDKPVLVVSAGPSLEMDLEIIKKIENKVFIFSTGRALHALLQKGIRVDMFCIIDCQKEATYNQIRGLEDLSIPFIFLDSASYYTVEAYKGPKYIAYSTENSENVEPIRTRGSVAIAIIDLAIKFGAKRIILIGQDLSYSNGTSHVSGANGRTAIDWAYMQKVKGIDGVDIPTSKTLLNIKRNIEKIIKEETHIEFINSTFKGAYIEGSRQVYLKDLFNSKEA